MKGMETDKNFDGLASRFEKNIYHTAKGKLRLQILQHDLWQTIPCLTHNKSLRILDAGGGFGYLAKQLAAMGHQVLLCDISQEMLSIAQQSERPSSGSGELHFVHAAIQSFAAACDEPFDVILCHAVLEWQVNPRQTLVILKPLLAEDGYLSLAFYNLDALKFRNLVQGNLRKVSAGCFRGEVASLTPTNPIEPRQLYTWLHELNYRVLSKSGIRVFYDYMRKEAQDKISFADILQMELNMYKHPSFLNLGRYIHLVCQSGMSA